SGSSGGVAVLVVGTHKEKGMTVDPLREPSRIAFTGDVHMNAAWTRQAIEHALELGADVIVQLGDFAYTLAPKFMRTVEKTLADADIPLLFVDGNHEAFDLLLRYRIHDNGLRKLTDHVWHLPRGFRWQWGGLDWVALGGAHSVDRQWREPGISWWREETITPQQEKRAIERGLVDVLIAHDCPTGVVVPGVDDRSEPAPFPELELLLAGAHRDVLRRVVDAVQPRAIWHGHYHVAYGRSVDFGYGRVAVTGLDCDATTLDANVQVVDLAEIARCVTGTKGWRGVGS
ncbi:MAG TPA: metallophosphoesterase, partial [Candidatus Limnocylindrales bacterium]